MPIEPGQIAALRKTIARHNERRIVAETQLQASHAEEARGLTQIRAEYDCETLPDIEAWIEREDAAIAIDFEALAEATRVAEAAAEAVPNA